VNQATISKEARESFGEFIRSHRQKKDLGIREIERISDGLIKAPYLSRIEHGRENPPGEGILSKLSEILEVDRDEIFAQAGKMPPELQEAYVKEKTVRTTYRAVKERSGEISEPGTMYQSRGELTDRSKLLAKELKRWTDILEKQYNPEKIILFGSFAKGRVHGWSDIDIIIIKKTDLPFLKRTREIIRLLDPMVGADFLVYTPQEFDELCKTRRFFKQEVLTKGTVIFERTH